MASIPTRESLHTLIDALSESEFAAAERALRVVRLRAITPPDDELLSTTDLEAVREARAEIGRGESVPRDLVMRQLRQGR